MAVPVTQRRVRERKRLSRGVRVACGQVLGPLMNLKQWNSIGTTANYFVREGVADWRHSTIPWRKVQTTKDKRCLGDNGGISIAGQIGDGPEWHQETFWLLRRLR